MFYKKSYAIAKAAVVPTTVETHEQLVEKNARLAFLSGIAGFSGAAPAALAQLIGGPGWSVVLAAITFGFAGLASLRLPKTTIAPTAEQEDEKKNSALQESPEQLTAWESSEASLGSSPSS